MTRRPNKPRSEWQSLVDQHKHSGLNIAAFCEQHDITEASFIKWRSVFKRESKGFAKVSVSQPTTTGKMRCTLPSGVQLEWDEFISHERVLILLKALS